jgi:hypothetical protein
MYRPVITLTTDFGLADAYVGIMKGVMLSICPEAMLIDISHEVRPHSVRHASYLLQRAAPYFPPGTVHLVVIDPGVGSERRPVAVQAERALYVAPDNGVLGSTLAQDGPRCVVHLTRSEYHLGAASSTFHGRDIFAPIAARLACGADPRDLGEEVPASGLVALPDLEPVRQQDGSWLGEIIHVDRFGNLITNCPGRGPDPHVLVSVGGIQIAGLRRTYSDVAPGKLVAYTGSSGYVEIAVREGSAASALAVDVGSSVQWVGAIPAQPGRAE